MPNNSSLVKAKLPALPRKLTITLKDEIRIYYHMSKIYVVISSIIFVTLLGVPVLAFIVNIFDPAQTKELYSLARTEIILSWCLTFIIVGPPTTSVQTTTVLGLTRGQALRNSLRLHGVFGAVQAVIVAAACLFIGRALPPNQVSWNDLLSLIGIGLLCIFGEVFYLTIYNHLSNVTTNFKAFKITLTLINGGVLSMFSLFTIFMSGHSWIIATLILGCVTIVLSLGMMVFIWKDRGQMMPSF